MLGQIKNAKQKRGTVTRPCHVLLPLSPNHGAFGGDGLYAESKIGLEALLNKWWSEGWSDYLSIAGVVIGWTRGTGLMNDNNMLAPALEERPYQLRTFAPAEMAVNITALLHRRMVMLAQHAPIWADFGGGFATIDKLKDVTDHIRKSLLHRARLKKSVADDREQERADICLLYTSPSPRDS